MDDEQELYAGVGMGEALLDGKIGIERNTDMLP